MKSINNCFRLKCEGRYYAANSKQTICADGSSGLPQFPCTTGSWQMLETEIPHQVQLLFPKHYFGNPGCTLCSSGFDAFQELRYSDISDSVLCSTNVQLLEASLFCISTQMKISHNLYFLVGKKAL